MIMSSEKRDNPSRLQTVAAGASALFMLTILACTIMEDMPEPFPAYAENIANFILTGLVNLLFGLVVFGIIGGTILFIAYLATH